MIAYALVLAALAQPSGGGTGSGDPPGGSGGSIEPVDFPAIDLPANADSIALAVVAGGVGVLLLLSGALIGFVLVRRLMLRMSATVGGSIEDHAERRWERRDDLWFDQANMIQLQSVTGRAIRWGENEYEFRERLKNEAADRRRSRRR